MPYAAPTLCAQPGCPARVTGGRYCPTHKRQRPRPPDGPRDPARRRFYGAEWKRRRERFLRDNPLCAECSKRGRRVLATVVDHTVPHRGDPELFWDERNWRPMCKPCHDRKTAAEDGGFGNPVRRRPR